MSTQAWRRLEARIFLVSAEMEFFNRIGPTPDIQHQFSNRCEADIHLITSFALYKTDSGTVTPRTFAVFKLTPSWYAYVRSTGRSAGLAPAGHRSRTGGPCCRAKLRVGRAGYELRSTPLLVSFGRSIG